MVLPEREKEFREYGTVDCIGGIQRKMRGSKPVTKGISRLAANYITYEDTAFPFSG